MPAEMSVAERVELRDEVLRAYRHAYGSYIKHACECNGPKTSLQVALCEYNVCGSRMPFQTARPSES